MPRRPRASWSTPCPRCTALRPTTSARRRTWVPRRMAPACAGSPPSIRRWSCCSTSTGWSAPASMLPRVAERSETVSSGGTTTISVLQDFELTDGQFERLRVLVREHTGIALSDAKRQLGDGRLARRLRALKLESFGQYIDLIERGEGGEVEEFVNAVTTNLTSFFREPHHFDYLGREMIPALVSRGGAHRLRIWCCAASTGE